MKRTPGDIARRANIADAASGFPSRPVVVVYAMAPADLTYNTTSQLCAQADARDWRVIAEVTDTGPYDSPLAGRIGWNTARWYINEGRASGIVLPREADTAGVPGLTEWLREHGAFLERLPVTVQSTEQQAAM
ncbi:hypothetical protein ABZV65_30850 [Streptomyces bauhiniae]|uniref:hypothetical protein n=1 Tax=Streptomyces bauhiniae TaxID=2340725 RepID=UPI0033A6B41C